MRNLNVSSQRFMYCVPAIFGQYVTEGFNVPGRYIVLYFIVLYCVVLRCVALRCVALHGMEWLSMEWHCMALYCIIIVYYIVSCIIYCITLRYIVTYHITHHRNSHERGNLTEICLGTKGHPSAALRWLTLILPPVFVQAAVIRSW